MMRKTKLFILLLCVSLCLVSCKDKPKEQKETQETEKKEKANIKTLTDLDVVTVSSQLPAVQEDQSWRFETDANQSCQPFRGIAESAENTYLNIKDRYLAIFPKDSDAAQIACGIEGCLHFSDECGARMNIGELTASGIQYYDGFLYYMVKDGGVSLYKMSLDGKTKWQSALLAANASSLSEDAFSWLIHRGYVYFWNVNEGISRVSLDNPDMKQLIIRRQEGATDNSLLKAFGSYLYFALPGLEENDWMFGRYNTEAGQIEYFPEITGHLAEFYVNDNKVYYQRLSDKVIYQYDISSGKNEPYLEVGEELSVFYADVDYLYVPKTDTHIEENVSGMKEEVPVGKDMSELKVNISNIKADVYNWTKERIGIVQIQEEISKSKEGYIYNDNVKFLGSDSDRIYYRHYGAGSGIMNMDILYLNKSEITENGAEIKNGLNKIESLAGSGSW